MAVIVTVSSVYPVYSTYVNSSDNPNSGSFINRTIFKNSIAGSPLQTADSACYDYNSLERMAEINSASLKRVPLGISSGAFH